MASEPKDGTQPLSPPRAYSDPLAGLVTGADAPQPLAADGEEAIMPPRAASDDADAHETTRRFLFDDDDEPEFDDRPKPAGDAFQPEEGQPGMLPVGPADHLRQTTGKRMRQVWKATQQQARNARAAAAQHQESQHQEEQGQEPAQHARQPTSPRRRNTGGVLVAIVMLAVFGVVALSVVVGIIQSITEAVD